MQITGLEPNLILGCNLTSDAVDLKGNVASITGSPVFSEADGVTFDGSSRIGYGDFIAIFTALTIAFYSKPSSFGTSKYVFSQTQATPFANSTFIIFWSGATYRLYIIKASGVYAFRECSISVNDGDHVAFVFSGSTRIDVYVNGVKRNGSLTGAIPDVMANSSVAVSLGASATNIAPVLGGSVKYVEMYDVAKSDAEITILFNTRETPDLPNPPETVNAYATAGVDGAIFVSWSAPSAGATPTSYNLYYSTTSPVTTDDTKISGLVIGDSPKIITGLTPAVEIFVAMTSENLSGESALSAEDSATPTGTAPDVPEITTLSQNVYYFENGFITIEGICGDAEQFILVFRNNSELVERVYHHFSGTDFTISDLPIIEGNNTFKLLSCSKNLCSLYSDTIAITGHDTKVTINNTFKLSSVAESFFDRLITDTNFHAWCNTYIGSYPKILLGVNENNYPDDDFFIAIMPERKNLGEVQNTNDVSIVVACVLSDGVVQNEISDPYTAIKYEKMSGVLLVDEIGEQVKKYLSLEAQKHGQSLDDVNYQINRVEAFPAYVCQFRVNITIMNTIGSNSQFTW